MGIGSMSGSRRAVFLDRDGVLNRAIVVEGKPYPPPSADALEIVPAAGEVLESLKLQGFLLMSSPINRMSPEGSKPARRWKGFTMC